MSIVSSMFFVLMIRGQPSPNAVRPSAASERYKGQGLVRPDGARTPAGGHYRQRLADRKGPVAPHESLAFFEDGAPRRFVNGAEHVQDRFGNGRVTRRWDPAANGRSGGHPCPRLRCQWGPSSVRVTPAAPASAHSPTRGSPADTGPL